MFCRMGGGPGFSFAGTVLYLLSPKQVWHLPSLVSPSLLVPLVAATWNCSQQGKQPRMNPSHRRELYLLKCDVFYIIDKRHSSYLHHIFFHRCHQRRRLSSDQDVHASPQHWDKVTSLHQVSVCRLSPSLQYSLFSHLERITVFSRTRPDLRSPSSHPSLSVFVPWK